MRRLFCLTMIVLGGCAAGSPDRPFNPSFPLTYARAERVLTYDAAHPRHLVRPVLVIGGFADPGFVAPRLRDRLVKLTGDVRVIAVSPGRDLSFTAMRQRTVAAVDAVFPNHDPARTAEVDVVGVSLGGTAARYSALANGDHRRLRIGRLFTLASPFRGAHLAELTPVDLHPLQAELRAGSAFYQWLDDYPPIGDLYPVYCYVRLGDGPVGVRNAAPAGTAPWWLQTPPGRHPHNSAWADARILADVAARLRGERPFTRDPPAPLPAGER